MNTKRLAAIAASVSVLTIAVPVFAHHSYAAYDLERAVTFNDVTLTEVKLIYPHSMLFFETKDEKGNVETWGGELNSPAQLSRMVGFKTSDFKVGRVVSIVAFPSKTGAKFVAYSKIRFSDGREFIVLEGRGRGAGPGE